jgi:YgiT-type zinc finger domain-containing protein
VRETVTLRVRGVAHRFADVPHERCPSCGERIFGVEASRTFDALITGRRRSHAA